MSAGLARLVAHSLGVGGVGLARKNHQEIQESGVGLSKGRAVVGDTQKPARDTSGQLGDQVGILLCWTSALLLNVGKPEPWTVTTVTTVNTQG